MSPVSPTVNVLRWTMLSAGVAYGFAHNRTLANNAEQKRFNAEWERKETLIQEAKKKYADLNKPKDTGNGPVSDPEDPNFDIVKLIEHSVKQLDG